MGEVHPKIGVKRLQQIALFLWGDIHSLHLKGSDIALDLKWPSLWYNIIAVR